MTVAIEKPKTVYAGLSYETYLELPLIKPRYDILDGDLIMSPAATTYHQWLLGNISYPVTTFVRENHLGVVLSAPVDVVIRKTPKLRTRQPDILYMSTARSGIKGRKELKENPRFHIAPDLAIEILSPDEAHAELPGKMQDYAFIGVLELWLVSSEAETVEVLALEAGAYKRIGRARRQPGFRRATGVHAGGGRHFCRGLISSPLE